MTKVKKYRIEYCATAWRYLRLTANPYYYYGSDWIRWSNSAGRPNSASQVKAPQYVYNYLAGERRLGSTRLSEFTADIARAINIATSRVLRKPRVARVSIWKFTPQ